MIWRATCIQMASDRAAQAADDLAAADVIRKNQDRLVQMIEDACSSGEKPALVVFPEFAMQGPPLGMPVKDWIKRACSTIPGPLTEPLQALAKREGIYIAGNLFEAPDEWPGRYFNSSFIIGPEGDVILRYRRVNTAAFPSVHDFMDEYLSMTPQEDVFPVVDTPLGRLATVPCGEIIVPEVSRVMMMSGAEVFLHPTNSRYSPVQEAAKLCRAAENMTYLVSANVAGPIGFSADNTVMGGRSHILDHHATTLAYQEDSQASLSVSAMIDLDALRRDRRADSGLSNPHLRGRYEMYAPYYMGAHFYPANFFATDPMTDVHQTSEAVSIARKNLERVRVLEPLAAGESEPASTVEH